MCLLHPGLYDSVAATAGAGGAEPSEVRGLDSHRMCYSPSPLRLNHTRPSGSFTAIIPLYSVSQHFLVRLVSFRRSGDEEEWRDKKLIWFISSQRFENADKCRVGYHSVSLTSIQFMRYFANDLVKLLHSHWGYLNGWLGSDVSFRRVFVLKPVNREITAERFCSNKEIISLRAPAPRSVKTNRCRSVSVVHRGGNYFMVLHQWTISAAYHNSCCL